MPLMRWLPDGRRVLCRLPRCEEELLCVGVKAAAEVEAAAAEAEDAPTGRFVLFSMVQGGLGPAGKAPSKGLNS